jgi:hypothetical protein
MATRIEVVVAAQDLIDQLKGRLRIVDQFEAAKIFGCMADDGLQDSFVHSLKCWVALYDGVPFAAFGVVPDGETGIPWLVGTPMLDKCSLTLVRECKWRVMAMLGTFKRLENYIWVGNSKSVRWLTYCGFRVETPIDGVMRFHYERNS